MVARAVVCGIVGLFTSSLVSICAQNESPLKTVFRFAQWADSAQFQVEIAIDPMIPMEGFPDEDRRRVSIKFFNSSGQRVAISTDAGAWEEDGTGEPILVLTLPQSGGLSVSTLGEDPLVSGWIEGQSDIRVAAQLTYKYDYGRYTGQEVVFPSYERQALSFRADIDRPQGVMAGLALANPTARRLRITASTEDPNTGEPMESVFFLDPYQHRSEFVDELFPGLSDVDVFDGVVELTVSDASNQHNPNGFVIATVVRFITKPDGQHNFSSSPVRAFPYKDLLLDIFAEHTELIYFQFRDRPDLIVEGYEKYFPMMMTLAQRLMAIETERGGFGRRTFSFDPRVRVIESWGNYDQYTPPGGDLNQRLQRLNEIGFEVLAQANRKRIAVIAHDIGNWGGSDRIWLSDYNIANIRRLENALESGSPKIAKDQDIGLGGQALFIVAHELGHSIGGLQHSTAIDASDSFGNTFTDFMKPSIALIFSPVFNVFPGVNWERDPSVGLDERHAVFSFDELTRLTRCSQSQEEIDSGMVCGAKLREGW